MSQEELQEAGAALPAPTLDMHRAIATLAEELAALDLCNQRFEACTDPELRRVLAQRGDVCRRQAAMLLEWMRRRDNRLDKELKDALFKAGPIVAQFQYE
ncbi:uncharacterized protein ACFDR9_003793 [Janthinobacterium sp. CG_23.3]|uniref:ferritin family protein n=1 Tax=unclassified Janthinobacterium TaxID=2610881 RepID=UPI000345E6E7|nr:MULTISPECIES: hypothetical protein [unclassified Janthinobacterium]MEC5164029.1 hypothetical protein [Janthinobacterium sp. CG_S6]